MTDEEGGVDGEGEAGAVDWRERAGPRNKLTSDRHRNIMSSVVLKKGIEEPWASERVARFINSSGYKEITLKSDTERAIIAFRNCTAESFKRRGHAGGRGQWRQTFKRIGRESSDVVARCDQDHQVPCGELHARRTPRRLPALAVVEGRDGRTPFERLHGPTQEFVPFGEKVLARPISSEPFQIQVRSVAGSEKQQCRVLRGHGRWCIQST